MANNNAIQILRTNGITNSNKDVALLEGQPFYNKQKNYLTVGDGTKAANGLPITVPTVEGWFDDITVPQNYERDTIESSTIGGGQDSSYSIKPLKRYSPVRNTANITPTNYLDIEADNIYLKGSTRVKNHIDFGEVLKQNNYVDYGARIVYTPAEENNTPGGTAGTLSITANEMHFNKKQDGTWERIDNHPGKLSLNADAGMSLNGDDGISLNGKTVITGTQNPGAGTVSPETEDIPLVVTTGQKDYGESGYKIASLIVGPRGLYSYEGSKNTIDGDFTYEPCSLAINQKAQAGVIIGNGIIQVGSDINGNWIGNCVGIGCEPDSSYKLKVSGITNIDDGTAATTDGGALQVTGGVKSGSLYTGITTITGVTSITNTTGSTGTSYGALKVLGGVGVAENLHVGGSITAASGQVKALKFTSDNSLHVRIEKSNELNFDVPSGSNKIFFNYRKSSSDGNAASIIRFYNGNAFTDGEGNTTGGGLGSIECAKVTCNDKVTLQYDTSSNALKFVFI